MLAQALCTVKFKSSFVASPVVPKPGVDDVLLGEKAPPEGQFGLHLSLSVQWPSRGEESRPVGSLVPHVLSASLSRSGAPPAAGLLSGLVL